MIDKLRVFIMNNKYLKPFLRPIYKLSQIPAKVKQNYIFKKYALEALIKLKKAFDEEDIIYWLEFGTLLGAVREKNFLKHDLDIDIGLFIENDQNFIEKILKNTGFEKVQQIEIDNGKYGLEQSYEFKGVTVDLFYFTKNEPLMFCHVFTTQYGISWDRTEKEKLGLVVYEHTFSYDGFKNIDFLNMNFMIPTNADQHLQEQYGESYMVKNKAWNPYKMATNKKILDNKVGFLV